MKTITHLSASQMETFEEEAGGCNRKWYLHKVVGLPIPQAASAALGEKVHGEIEKYLETGDVSVLGPIARPALDYLPPPKSVIVETKMDCHLVDTLKFTGRIDVLDFRVDRKPRVLDHKTTSDLRYAKTAEELRRNIQMLAYAKYALTYYPVDATPDHVTVAHGVLLTRGSPRSQYTEATLTRLEIESGWSRLQTLGRRMKAVSLLDSPAKVKPNLSACNKYGGCPFRDKCAVIDNLNANPFASVQEPSTMPLPASIAAKLGLSGAAATPAQPAAVERKTTLPADAPKVLTAEYLAGLPKTGAVKATGVVPPDAPPSAKEEKAQAAALAAHVAAPLVSDEEKALAAAVANGWSEDEINAMGDEAFEAAQSIARADAEVVEGTDDQGTYIEAIRPKPAPVAAAPVGRRGSRTAAAAPVVEPAAPVAVVEAPAATAPASSTASYGMPLKLLGWSKDTVEKRLTAAQAVVIKEHKINFKTVGLDGLVDGDVVVSDDEGRMRIKPDGSLVADTTPVAEAKPEPVVEEAPKARGRKAKTEPVVETKTADITDAAVEHGVPGDQQIPEGALVMRHVDAPASLRLFVDCLPEKGVDGLVYLDDLVKPYMAAAAASYKDPKSGQQGVTHYSLIPYNQGPGQVAAYLLVNPPKGTVVVDSRSPCAAACLEVLRPLADVVIRAVR